MGHLYAGAAPISRATVPTASAQVNAKEVEGSVAFDRLCSTLSLRPLACAANISLQSCMTCRKVQNRQCNAHQQHTRRRRTHGKDSDRVIWTLCNTLTPTYRTATAAKPSAYLHSASELVSVLPRTARTQPDAHTGDALVLVLQRSSPWRIFEMRTHILRTAEPHLNDILHVL
jgi:hypothetical protein